MTIAHLCNWADTEWHRKFMDLAKFTATWSKDPRVKVGAIAVDASHTVLSGGYNGFPRKIKDDARLHDKEVKNLIVVHAEMNMIAEAAKKGRSLEGSIIYCTQPPCAKRGCASLLIQCGVKTIIHLSNTTQTWAEDFEFAKKLFEEAGIEMIEIDPY